MVGFIFQLHVIKVVSVLLKAQVLVVFINLPPPHIILLLRWFQWTKQVRGIIVSIRSQKSSTITPHFPTSGNPMTLSLMPRNSALNQMIAGKKKIVLTINDFIVASSTYSTFLVEECLYQYQVCDQTCDNLIKISPFISLIVCFCRSLDPFTSDKNKRRAKWKS